METNEKNSDKYVDDYMDCLFIHSPIHRTGVKLIKTIHSCENEKQLVVAEKLVKNYKTMYGVDRNHIIAELFIERKREDVS